MSPEVIQEFDKFLITMIAGGSTIVAAAVGYVVWRFKQRLIARKEKGKDAAPTAG